MPTPDYRRIAQLERELGIGEQHPQKSTQSSSKVCLIKECTGADTEIRSWNGVLIRRVHEH